MKTCSSDDGELILLENSCFIIDRAELTWIYFLQGMSWMWIEKYKSKKIIHWSGIYDEWWVELLFGVIHCEC